MCAPGRACALILGSADLSILREVVSTSDKKKKRTAFATLRRWPCGGINLRAEALLILFSNRQVRRRLRTSELAKRQLPAESIGCGTPRRSYFTQRSI